MSSNDMVDVVSQDMIDGVQGYDISLPSDS